LVCAIYFTMIFVQHISFQILTRKNKVRNAMTSSFFLYYTIITGFLVSNLDSNAYIPVSRYSFCYSLVVVVITWFWLMHLKMHIKTNENPLKRQITFDNLFMLLFCVWLKLIFSCHVICLSSLLETKNIASFTQNKGCSNPHNMAISDN